MTTKEKTLVTGVDFIVLPTQDFDGAIEFYGTTLGLPELKRYGKHPGVEFETGNLTLAVMESEAFGLEFNPNKAGVALRVADVEATRADLESKGISFFGETIDSGVCHQAFFTDPDGNALILHHRYAPPGKMPAAAEA